MDTELLIQKSKQYFWSIFSAIGIVFFWAGVLDGIGSLPYIDNPLSNLIIGITLLATSGYLFQQFSPLDTLESSIKNVLHQVQFHPNKEKFNLAYHDKLKNKYIFIKGNQINKVEKNHLIIKHPQGKELFIPLHRIKEIRYNNQSVFNAQNNSDQEKESD